MLFLALFAFLHVLHRTKVLKILNPACRSCGVAAQLPHVPLPEARYFGDDARSSGKYLVAPISFKEQASFWSSIPRISHSNLVIAEAADGLTQVLSPEDGQSAIISCGEGCNEHLLLPAFPF